MAKQRLNKNLVAFITGAGIVLAVIVVAIAAFNASRRNPEEIALKAEAQERAGDPRRAIRLYQRAFAESEEKDPKYLLEAARVARGMGDLNTMFGLLNFAYAQSPDDPEVLNALLTRYWEIRDFSMGQWRDVRERATKLCQQEPDNLLALASLAEALEWLSSEPVTDDDRNALRGLEWLNVDDADFAGMADQILTHAAEIDPTSPQVALVRAKQSLLRAGQQLRQALQQERRSDVDRIVQQATARRIEHLQPALEAHPDDIALRVACAQALADSEQWADSRALLEAGIEKQSNDPDLHYELARVYLQEIRQNLRDAVGEALDQLEGASPEERRARAEDTTRAAIDQTLVTEGMRHAKRAIELEPALYRAYVRRADFQQLGWIGDGSWMEDLPGRQKEILESYAAALRDTVGLESFRAVLAGFRLERLELISAAFDSAQSFHRGSTDEQVRSQALTYLRRFLQEAQTQFPGRARTLLMEGYVALIDGDERLALKAFTEAEKQAQPLGSMSLTFARLAVEELSKLYRTRGELGSSLKYTQQAIDNYRQQQETPPGWLYIQQVDLLLTLDRAQEALELVESIAELFPDWPPLKAAGARALTALDRSEEAMQQMQALPSDDPRYLFEQGKIAMLNEDYDTAVNLFGKVLETDPEHIPTIDRLLRALVAAERNDEAQQFVREHLETTTNEQLRRLLQSFDLVLSESDPEVRKQKRLEMIAAIPDEYERAEEFFHFWQLQGKLKQARPYLDQMERLREDDPHVLRLQFEVALRTNDCERAERYTAALAQANVDQVGGAMFRGRYELRCGEVSSALTELRAAERVFPRDSELKTHIARALMRLTPPRYTQAIQALEEAVDSDPRSFDAQKLLYACYEATGRRDEGIPHLATAAELAKQLRIKDEYVEAHAELLDEERDPQQGIENREKLRAESPQDVANLLRLAELYKKVGDFELAQQRLRAAVQADPGSAMVARFAANFFAQRDDREAGEELLRQHLEAQEGLGEIVARALLGRFYEMLADRRIVRIREMVSAGETADAVNAEQDALIELYELALQAYQQAQERAPDALAGSPEEDRHRAIVASASELADFYRRTKRWDDMIEAYRVILSHLDPDDTASIQLARLRIISGLQSLRRYGEARDELERYRQDYPENLNGMMAAAEFLMAGGEPEGLTEARELLSRVLAENPNDAWSLYMRGLVNVQQQSYTAARDDLLRAKNVAPEAFNLQHRFDLAKLYELMDQPRLAEAELRELFEVERRGGRDVELQLIAFLERTKQLDKALEFVNQLIVRDPKQPFWPYELGKLLMERGEYSAAVQPLRKSVELTDYNNSKTIEDLLQAMVRGNRAGEAIREYEGLLPKLVQRRLEPPRILTPSIKTYAAEAYLAEKRRDITVSLLEQAINEASVRGGVHLVRDVTGRAQLLLGRAEGLALLRSVLEQASQPEAELAMRIALADFLATSGGSAEHREALEIVEAVLSQLPEDSQLRFEALQVQALGLDRTGRPEEAVAVYEQAVKLAPNDLRTLNNLAYLLADRLGRSAEALPYARQLHELAPTLEPHSRPAAYDTVGWVFFKAGNNEQAVPAFLEALRIEPDYLAARYHLGLVYADSGRRVPAEEEFRELLLRIRDQMAGTKSDEQRLKLEEYQNKAEEALEKLR